MPITLQARVVYPVDRPAIEHGVVTIDAGRIVAVGERAEGDVQDLGDVALLPGLVNAHTHLEFSQLRSPLGKPGMRLADWIRLVLAERGKNDESPAEAIRFGCRECLKHGVTAVGEIATAEVADYSAHAKPDLTLLTEVIGFSRARSNSAFAAAVDRLDSVRAADAFRAGLSPHAPYTVSPPLLNRLIDLATQHSLPVAMHLAESKDELELLATGCGPLQELLDERSMWDGEAIPHGSRPLEYLKILARAPRSLVIHGNYLGMEDWAFLADNRDRMSLIYCPRTHAFFGHPPYPLAQLLATGVHVALGTDSRASNPDLSLLAEMRTINRTYPAIDPQTILRLGTLAGAEALGQGDNRGSIAPGKLADLVALPLPSGAQGSPDDLLAALLAADNRPSHVWLRGEQAI